VIERLGDKGEPVEPKGIAARFQNIVGAIVRDQLASWITTTNWKTVPKATKDVPWAKVKEKFVYPDGTENAGRTFAEGLCGRALRHWKSTLNTEFVQKGKDARDVYGNIPLEVWEEFVDQKKMAEAVALSVQQMEKAMKAAENPHRLGSGGYAAKMAKWRKEEEERRVAGLPTTFEGMDERSRNWILARVPAIAPDGNVSFQKTKRTNLSEAGRTCENAKERSFRARHGERYVIRRDRNA
jgi:hypothetical protein